jgi:DNA-binding transcriptional ArsR family regulator
MEGHSEHNLSTLSGDELLRVLSALANPHRLRIVGVLTAGRNYVSQLAREIGMSRPLLHMHLRRLEAAGLVRGTLTLSEEEGKAMRYFEVVPFALALTPEGIAAAVQTLTEKPDGNAESDKQNQSEEE